MATTLTLSETVDLAQRVLDENKVVPASKRAAASLSGRNVRWYTTAGILDAPGREGHAAAYGKRHLLQLLYTRKAQAQGTPLERIREDTTSLSTNELVAQIGLDLSSVPQDLTDVAPRKEQPFWERTPVEAAPAPSATPGVTRSAGSAGVSVRFPRTPLHTTSAHVEYVVHVGPVSVSLDHDPTADEVAVIEIAAQPLLSHLASIDSPTEINPTKPLPTTTASPNRSIQ